MLLLIPIAVDVPMARWPWMNWAIIALTIIFLPIADAGDSNIGAWCVAGGEHWLGHLLHPLAHLDVIHLFGNMLFLWVFGNAICAKIGNLPYLAVYFVGALLGSLITSVLNPTPGIGASGAINTVVGFFLAWYALNDVRMFLLLIIRPITFELAAYWVILMWLAFDVWGALGGDGFVDYVAHVMGFLLGFGAAIALLKLGWVTMDDDERSILDILKDRAPIGEEPTSARKAIQVRIPLPTPDNARPTGQPSQQRRPAPKRVEEDPIPLADEPTQPKEKRSF
ncbi:MAG: rhomboid family intramembrane serine protease [Phycisphaerae bacterium]|nr:rhomboid family intramembrane serine protease [Phycisphaerae bacterium]